MEFASGKVGLEWFLPNLAVSFDPGDGTPRPGQPLQNEPPNLHGATRLTCLLCGECNIGCNFGAKNTLDYNYLSRATLDHGAQIRTRCEVKTFAPRDGRRLHGRLRRPQPRGRGREAAAPAADEPHHVRPARALGRQLRHDVPAAEEPRRVPEPLPPGRDALLRQRRPAHPRHPRPEERRAAHRRRGLRARDHQHGPRQGQGGGRPGPRVLRPGRRPSAARRLDRRDELPARR